MLAIDSRRFISCVLDLWVLTIGHNDCLSVQELVWCMIIQMQHPGIRCHGRKDVICGGR